LIDVWDVNCNGVLRVTVQLAEFEELTSRLAAEVPSGFKTMMQEYYDGDTSGNLALYQAGLTAEQFHLLLMALYANIPVVSLQ
jgi:hypothetical protein